MVYSLESRGLATHPVSNGFSLFYTKVARFFLQDIKQIDVLGV